MKHSLKKEVLLSRSAQLKNFLYKVNHPLKVVLFLGSLCGIGCSFFDDSSQRKLKSCYEWALVDSSSYCCLKLDSTKHEFKWIFVGGLAADTIIGDFSIKGQKLKLHAKEPIKNKIGENPSINLTFFDGKNLDTLGGVALTWDNGMEDTVVLTGNLQLPLYSTDITISCLGYQGVSNTFFSRGNWNIYLFPQFRTQETLV